MPEVVEVARTGRPPVEIPRERFARFRLAEDEMAELTRRARVWTDGNLSDYLRLLAGFDVTPRWSACGECHERALSPTRVTDEFWVAGEVYRVRGVPAMRCERCGSVHVDGVLGAKIEAALEKDPRDCYLSELLIEGDPSDG